MPGCHHQVTRSPSFYTEGVKVIAAMSGGVDSAVAAARAKDAGHEVVGVHLALSRSRNTLRTGSRGCCTVEDALDARRVAQLLDIPFYVWDFSERFQADVVDNFMDEYREGRTPNPCLRCNEKIKFEAVLDRALALGFDAVVTGHYARIDEGPTGERELHRASAWAKDQSYVLGVLTAEQLAHCLFPLGETPSKDLVRQEAAERGFTLAQKPDSHDICFIPDGDTQGYLLDKLGVEPGNFVDARGRSWGTTTALTSSPLVSAGASTWDTRQRTGNRAMSSTFGRRQRRSSWVRRMLLRRACCAVSRSPSPGWTRSLGG